MYCSNCGAPVREGNVFCGNCGQRIGTIHPRAEGAYEPSVSTASSDTEMMINEQDGFEPIQTGSPSAFGGVTDNTVPDSMDNGGIADERVGTVVNVAHSDCYSVDSYGKEKKTDGMVNSSQNTAGVTMSSPIGQSTSRVAAPAKESSRQSYLSGSNLWTWLKKDERRQLFYSEDRDLLSEDNYMANMGEDVSEAFVMLDDKRDWVISCQDRLRELGNRLDTVLDSLEFSDWQSATFRENDSISMNESQHAIDKELQSDTIATVSYNEQYAAVDCGAASGVLSDGTPLSISRIDAGKYSDSLSQGTNGDEYYANLAQYMYAHNYSADDFATYSQDPEWNRLHRAAFPGYHQIIDHEFQHASTGTSPDGATTDVLQVGAGANSVLPSHGEDEDAPWLRLKKYMNSHHYSAADYDTYSKDPEWNELHKKVFPDYHQIAEYEFLHEEKVDWVKQLLPNLDDSDVERTVKALEWYTGNGYNLIHWDSDGNMQETRDILAVIDSTDIHTFKGWMYRGLSFESEKDLIKQLEEYGGYWKEPGITSFTTDLKTAMGFASEKEWGLVLKCTNNKTAIPVRHLSRFSWENEVLSPGGLRNKGWIIDQTTIIIDENQHLIFADMKETLSG